MTGLPNHFARPAAVIAVLVCAACSQTGDFGRSTANPNENYAVTHASAETRSEHFSITDEEREMNSRIHRFMSMSHTEPWLHRAMLARVGVVSGEVDRTAYYSWIKSTQFASSRGPYNRLHNDIRLDLASLPQTFAAICKVVKIDRRRSLALDNLVNVEPAMQAAANERFDENRGRINQFAEALGFRYDAYVYALEHLLIETPHEQARDVDADLSNLATASGAAFAGDFCLQPRQYASATDQPGLGAI